MPRTITTHPPSHLTRAVWLALGTFFAGLTARVLLWEASGVRDLSPHHLLTIGAMVGAVSAGVFFGHMLRQYKFVTALGLGVAFLAATGYCLINSAGRGDEAAFAKNAEVRQAQADYERAQRSLDEAQVRYRAALDAETAECRSGEGGRCKAARKTTAERRSDREVAELLLRQSKPAGRVNGKLLQAAEFVAFFSRINRDVAEQGLALLWPFIPPLVCELLTITFLHLGFASVPHRVPRAVPPVPALEPANDPGPKPGSTVEPEIVAGWIAAFRARAGRDPQIPELQAQFPMPKTTAWRRLQANKARPLVVLADQPQRRALGRMARAS